MFRKKPVSESSPSQPPSQSQSLSHVSLSGGMVQMAQAGGNVEQRQEGHLSTQQQGLTGAEVVALLEQLELAVKGAGLEAAQQEELLDYSSLN